MHIFFSGIGGTGIGPLALIAKQAGYTVSGSDKQASKYIEYLIEHGVTDIHIGQDYASIQAINERVPIDWLVYSSAVEKEQADSPELAFCRDEGIKTSKRDELINQIIQDKNLKLIAIAGTHGKTTTTAMTIWLMMQLGMPVSYSVGAKIGFGDMGAYDSASEYFVYEADEYDRNFLAFEPYMSIITGIDWDHADIYPTRHDYEAAFVQFLDQSARAVVWRKEANKLFPDDILLAEPMTKHSLTTTQNELTLTVLDETHKNIGAQLGLTGLVNRQNAWQVANAMHVLTGQPLDQLTAIMNDFPGVSRRFEAIQHHLYTDYAHTPEKIRGAIQTANEVAPGQVVVVYEGLHNTRQHFIKQELPRLFETAKALYISPSYLAREDESLEMLTPEKLCRLIDQPKNAKPVKLDDDLKRIITKHVKHGDLVLCLTAGGGGSLDEWLRHEFLAHSKH